jgi:hypothetical protein
MAIAVLLVQLHAAEYSSDETSLWHSRDYIAPTVLLLHCLSWGTSLTRLYPRLCRKLCVSCMLCNPRRFRHQRRRPVCTLCMKQTWRPPATVIDSRYLTCWENCQIIELFSALSAFIFSVLTARKKKNKRNRSVKFAAFVSGSPSLYLCHVTMSRFLASFEILLNGFACCHTDNISCSLLWLYCIQLCLLHIPFNVSGSKD